MYDNDLKTFLTFNAIGGIIGLIVFACLGYFVYGGISGSAATVVVCFIYGLTAIIALIPYVGFIAQIATIHFFVWPWISELTKIQATWLTTVLLILTIISGFIYTASTTFAIRSGY
jgi:hypothetical protein